MTPRYIIKVNSKDGTLLGEFENYHNLKFGKKLNNFGQASFDLPVNDGKLSFLTALRSYEVQIFRDNDRRWAGEQFHRMVTLVGGDAPELVTVRAYTFLELLNHRHSGPNDRFDNVDAGAIFQSLVTTTNTEDPTGITVGTVESTVPRDRTYNNKNIMQAGIELTQVLNGFDLEVTDEKVLNIYERKGLDLSSNIVFEYGTNIEPVTIEEDFSSPVNKAIVLGAGSGSAQTIVEVTDTDSVAAIGLREGRVSATDVSDIDNLTDKGEEEVRIRKQPIQIITFDQMPNTFPEFGAIDLGDSVRVKIKKGIYNIDAVYRVYGYEVKVGENGEEFVRYQLSNA